MCTSQSMLEVASLCYTVSTSTTFGVAYLEELELGKDSAGKQNEDQVVRLKVVPICSLL